MKKLKKKSSKAVVYAKEGLIKGFFWSIGVTFGLAFVSIVLVFVLSRFQTIPVIGEFVANIVEATNSSLESNPTLR